MAKVIQHTSSLAILGALTIAFWLETGFRPVAMKAILGKAGCAVGGFLAHLPIVSLILSIFQ